MDQVFTQDGVGITDIVVDIMVDIMVDITGVDTMVDMDIIIVIKR